MTFEYFPNRTLCNVLEEMRKAYETRNFSYLPGLIEELQSLANRMESALYDVKDVKKLQEERSELKAQVKKLRQEKKQLGGKNEDF